MTASDMGKHRADCSQQRSTLLCRNRRKQIGAYIHIPLLGLLWINMGPSCRFWYSDLKCAAWRAVGEQLAEPRGGGTPYLASPVDTTTFPPISAIDDHSVKQVISQMVSLVPREFLIPTIPQIPGVPEPQKFGKSPGRLWRWPLARCSFKRQLGPGAFLPFKKT